MGTQKLNDYKYFRINKIDPISLDEIDENGSLLFDCNSLIYYFYTNRLNNLWIPSHMKVIFFVEGHYGDALGKSPDFEIKGRGSHKEWHLFRLPIIDCYVPKNSSLKYITMGPILSDKDLKKIYKLSNKKIYDKAIDPFNQYDDLNLDKSEIDLIKFDLNT